jgi:hypothetical protein
MSYNHEDYQKLRQRVEERFNQRTEWAMHTVSYLVTVIALTLLDLNLGLSPTLIRWVVVLWGGGVVMHGVKVFLETYLWVQARENAIQHEIEIELWHREGRVPSFIEKPKRMPRLVQLSDDGELITEEMENDQHVRPGYRS